MGGMDDLAGMQGNLRRYVYYCALLWPGLMRLLLIQANFDSDDHDATRVSAQVLLRLWGKP